MSAIDLGMDFQMPKNQSSQIKVMGIGGGGSNKRSSRPNDNNYFSNSYFTMGVEFIS